MAKEFAVAYPITLISAAVTAFLFPEAGVAPLIGVLYAGATGAVLTAGALKAAFKRDCSVAAKTKETAIAASTPQP
jgi:hypothetical protein